MPPCKTYRISKGSPVPPDSPRTCVITNPAAGRGKAARLLKAARPWLPVYYEMPTSRAGEGVELARSAAEAGYERIIAAGGDGTAHEVANGILLSGRDVLFSTWPIGSSNDYARTLGLAGWWASRGRGVTLAEMRVDVGRATSAGRERYFVNGAGVGFNGMVTYEAQRITWLRGTPLYTLAFLQAMRRHYITPPMTLTLDGRQETCPTLSISFNLGQREGGFPITWAARLDDGLFDTFHPRRLRRWQLVRYLPALLTGKLPQDHPEMGVNRCSRASVGCKLPVCVHTDGELFCDPADESHEVAIELLPGRLWVEICPEHLYHG